MAEKTPQTVRSITPVELALVEYTDGEYKDSAMLVAIATNITELSPTDPKLQGSVKVIDWVMPDGKWRNTGGVSNWLAKGILNLLKQKEPQGSPSAVIGE
jgi:hypothetical protein